MASMYECMHPTCMCPTCMRRWGVQLRVLLIGGVAELELCRAVWPAPYDDLTFSEVLGTGLRALLQVRRGGLPASDPLARSRRRVAP